MTALQGIEPAILALQSRLQSNLPAAVAQINSEHSDGIVIPDPAQVLDYMPALSLVSSFPTVALIHGRGTFEDDNGWSATGRYEVGIVPILQDGDARILSVTLRRYVLAVLRVALAGRTLGVGTGVPWSVQLINIDYGPAYERSESDAPPKTYWTWGEVLVEIKLNEE